MIDRHLEVSISNRTRQQPFRIMELLRARASQSTGVRMIPGILVPEVMHHGALKSCLVTCCGVVLFFHCQNSSRLSQGRIGLTSFSRIAIRTCDDS
jgi:hypothetical protein